MIHKNWAELIKPQQLDVKPGNDPARQATVMAEPLERGFGLTLGNALRRVLMSSLQGAAITSVQIDNVLHDSPYVHYHEMEITELNGYELLHCGGSTKTPWNTEREYTEKEYAAKFSELVPQVQDMRRCIFNVHVPPFGTVLDQCPKLDENLQVVFEMGNPVQMHAGSSALLDTLKVQQPMLGIHGHIHEGRGNIKIGNTVCVNPGSVYPEGLLQGVLVTLNNGEVESVQLTQG